MGMLTREDIVNLVEEEDVEFIRLQFVDSFGNLKNLAMTADHLDQILDGKVVFDGAAISGYDSEDFTEYFLIPDLDTFTIFPWRPQNGRVARFICDVVNLDRTPYEGDSRYILKKVLEKAKSMGYTFLVAPENEFFLFDTDEQGNPTTHTQESGGFFDVGPVDAGENARRDIVLALEEMGFSVDESYHSNEIAQHCINFHMDEALKTADNMLTFKLAVRTVAKRHGYHATFMPKPKYGVKGSAMAVHMSLLKDGKNLFADGTKEDGLSEEAYHFMAGLIQHIQGLTLINNPIINSYKRLVPGYNAPVEVTWSKNSRTPLIRITDVGSNPRVVLRSPDGASNPYLVLAGCLAAGLEGIVKKSTPPVCLEEGMKDHTQFDILPRSLHEAVKAYKEDPFIQDVIGETLSGIYLKEKENQWIEFSKQVTQWEVHEYLNRI